MAVKAAQTTPPENPDSVVDLSHVTPRLQPLAVAMDSLTLDPTNARSHNRKNLDAIKGSLARFGQRVPLVVNARTSIIEKGNGTYLAARELGWTYIAVVDVDDDTLDAAGFAIADNRTGELAEWEYSALVPQLEALQESGFALEDIGFPAIDVDEALALWRNLGSEIEEEEEGGEGEGRVASDGSLLALAHVTIAEPQHNVEKGDVWKVGNHLLICADVLTGWPHWITYLQGESIFAPYPGPLVPLTVKAQDCHLVMVQPDIYIAGHILDQWCAVHGEASIEKVKQGVEDA